jgi:hypothetical protein
MLLCGPTHAFFRRLIEERLGLPTRIVAIPGTFYREQTKTISYVTHNMPEVYLPDIGKFVLFDINNSFVSRWLTANEFAKKVNDNVGDTLFLNETFDLADIDIYHGVDSYLPRRQIVKKPVRFRQKLISNTAATESWLALFHGFSGGVAYWGGKLDYVKPTGTEFLTGEYWYASLHKDAVLKDAAIKRVESFKINVEVVSPERLESMLEEGHKNLIESKSWLEKLPDQGRIRE